MAKKTTETLIGDSKNALSGHLALLTARLAEIRESSKALRDERDVYLAEQGELDKKIDVLTAQINEIERPEIITIQEEMSRVARIMGGRAMSDNRDDQSQPQPVPAQ